MTDKNKVEFIESYIKIGSGDYQLNDNHGELIRCKDCKHGEICKDEMGKAVVECFKQYRQRTIDWFCADGERD